MRKTWAAGIVAAGVVLATLAMAPMAAAQQDEEGPTSLLNFQVLKDDNGKPVRSASVIMHPVGGNGKQGKGGMELKRPQSQYSIYGGADKDSSTPPKQDAPPPDKNQKPN